MLWHKLIGFAVLCLALTQLHLVSSDVAAAAASSNYSTAGCAKNFSRVGDKCLLAVNSWYNWYEADRHCRQLGGGLLSLQNQTQLQQINTWLNATASFTAEFWTSGNMLGQKADYYWQSTGERASYLPWSTGQPQIYAGDCLVLYANNYTNWGVNNFRLTVKTCTNWSAHICEQKPQNYTSRICLTPGTYETAQILI